MVRVSTSYLGIYLDPFHRARDFILCGGMTVGAS